MEIAEESIPVTVHRLAERTLPVRLEWTGEARLSRIKLDPWRNQITLIKTRPLQLLSPREKMPFEITPFILYLTRLP